MFKVDSNSELFGGRPRTGLIDSRLTLLALGAMAGLIAACGHEAVGHGGACLLAGGSITLLTTTQFHCAGSTPAVDAAGPAVNVLLAVFAGLTLWRFPRLHLSWRLFCVAVLAFNVFWFAGEAIRSPIDAMDDEAAMPRTLHWAAWWRPVCGLLAAALYWLTTRLLVPVLRFVAGNRSGAGVFSRVVLMYLGGTLALTLEGLCTRTGHLSGAFGGGANRVSWTAHASERQSGRAPRTDGTGGNCRLFWTCSAAERRLSGLVRGDPGSRFVDWSYPRVLSCVVFTALETLSCPGVERYCGDCEAVICPQQGGNISLFEAAYYPQPAGKKPA